MSAVRIAAACLLLVATAACGSGPPERSRIRPAVSPEAIAERFLDARRRGDAEDVWDCLAGPAERRRVYRGTRPPSGMRTWREFRQDMDLGWAHPPLAPANVWEEIGRREEGGLTILVFRQGTKSEPDRGIVELAVVPAGSGWLMAWVDVPR